MRANNRRGLVAVITGKEDAHVPFVERHLTVPLVLLDTRDLVDGVELTYRLTGDTITASFRGESLQDVVGVWYRKPQPIPRQKLPVEESLRSYCFDAMERHTMMLRTSFDGATWVSDYYAMGRANQKSLQMAVARRLGFSVPETVITSDSAVAQAFIQEHPRVVIKSLTPTYPKLEDKQNILLTRLVTKDTPKPDLTNLFLAPSIFQEAIDAKYDVRVIVVGREVFPAIMTSGAEEAGLHSNLRDNRLGDTRLAIATDFPNEIAEKCVSHVKALGLNFGAIDLLIDSKGRYWFLENNPNGQWAFVEDATGQPIGRALARLLEGHALSTTRI